MVNRETAQTAVNAMLPLLAGILETALEVLASPVAQERLQYIGELAKDAGTLAWAADGIARHGGLWPED